MRSVNKYVVGKLTCFPMIRRVQYNTRANCFKYICLQTHAKITIIFKNFKTIYYNKQCKLFLLVFYYIFL